MQPHSWVAIVTLVALLVYVWMIFRIGRAGQEVPASMRRP
jgi:glutathione S-transferase